MSYSVTKIKRLLNLLLLPTPKSKGYTFPEGSIIQPATFLLLCKTETFTFGIGGSDILTLLNSVGNVVSTTTLTGGGSTTLTLNRRSDSNYVYSVPSPGTKNIFLSPSFGYVVINEVADKPVLDTCGGTSEYCVGSFVLFLL